MIISERHGFTFIHNPKVAGTSIRKSIEQYHDQKQVYWHQRYDERLKRVVDLAHIPYDDLDNQVKAIMAKTFNFGFVRHPVKRFFSAYAEFQRQHADWFPSKMDPSYFVCYFLTEANVRYDWRFTHFCPQHYFFYQGNKCVADYIGRHEDFANCWQSIQNIVAPSYGFQPLDNTRHRELNHASDPVLGDEALTILQNLYQRDFTLFNYADPFCDLVNSEGRHTHWQRVELLHKRLTHGTTELTLGEKVAHLELQVADYKKLLENK
jgi:hypothetical protein